MALWGLSPLQSLSSLSSFSSPSPPSSTSIYNRQISAHSSASPLPVLDCSITASASTLSLLLSPSAPASTLPSASCSWTYSHDTHKPEFHQQTQTLMDSLPKSQLPTSHFQPQSAGKLIICQPPLSFPSLTPTTLPSGSEQNSSMDAPQWTCLTLVQQPASPASTSDESALSLIDSAASIGTEGSQSGSQRYNECSVLARDSSCSSVQPFDFNTGSFLPILQRSSSLLPISNDGQLQSKSSFSSYSDSFSCVSPKCLSTTDKSQAMSVVGDEASESETHLKRSVSGGSGRDRDFLKVDLEASTPATPKSEAQHHEKRFADSASGESSSGEASDSDAEHSLCASLLNAASANVGVDPHSPLSLSHKSRQSNSERPLKSTRARLAAQKKYDLKKRDISKKITSDLRQNLKSADALTRMLAIQMHRSAQPHIKIESSPTAAANNTQLSVDRYATASGSLSSASASGSSAAAGSVSSLLSSSSKEVYGESVQPFSVLLEKPIDFLSTHQLMCTAAAAIRQLNQMKDKLVEDLAHIDEQEGETECEVEGGAADDIDGQTAALTGGNGSAMETDDDKCDFVGVHRLERSDEPGDELVPAKKRQRTSSAECMNEIDTLLHAIKVVNDKYAMELKAVHAVQNRLPAYLDSFETVFQEYGVIGADARIVSRFKFLPNSQFERAWARVSANVLSDDVLIKTFREPRLSQLHAISFVLCNNFSYSDEENAELNDKLIFRVQAADPLPQFTAPLDPKSVNLMQLLRDSFMTAAKQPKMDMDIHDQRYLQHPLGRFALPPASFKAMQETLAFLVGLGQEEYEHQLDELLPLAENFYPSSCPTTDIIQDLRLGANDRSRSPRELTFHRLFSPTFQQIVALHQLYNEGRPLVTMQRRAMPTDFESVMYIDVDTAFIRDPVTNFPVAHLGFVRNVYFGEKYDDVVARLAQKARAQTPNANSTNNHLRALLSNPHFAHRPAMHNIAALLRDSRR